jgi:hypothetical protein
MIHTYVHNPGPVYESEKKINLRKDRSIDYLCSLFVYSIESHTIFSPIVHNHNSNYI